jgi:hypothetical protein
MLLCLILQVYVFREWAYEIRNPNRLLSAFGPRTDPNASGGRYNWDALGIKLGVPVILKALGAALIADSRWAQVDRIR